MNVWKREPALVLGIAASVLTVIGQVLAHELSWAAAVPLVVAAITRANVYSPASVQRLVLTPKNPAKGD